MRRPNWQHSELLQQAVDKIGGNQTVFAQLATAHTGYRFNQSEISKLCAAPHRINNANRLNALLAVIENVLAGKLFPAASSGSRDYRKGSTETDRAAKVEFWTVYPPSYERDFARATELAISGLDLRRLHARMGDLKRVVRQKGRVRIIFLDPEYYELCRYGAMQDWGNKDTKFIEAYRESIWTTYLMLRKLVRGGRTSSSDKRKRRPGGFIEIKTLRYPLGFGIDWMNFDDSGGGAIYVRNYPMYADVEDRPIVPLTAADAYWYSFYKEQFEIHWRNALPWANDKKRTWKDLRTDYGGAK